MNECAVVACARANVRHGRTQGQYRQTGFARSGVHNDNDPEDIYITLRYVKNFVDGKGLVFNTFDKVEGYSDFLWVMLIAGFHKIFHTDIPFTARFLGLISSIAATLFTYFLTLELTGKKLLSYLAAFLVGVNGSFACYGISGLENPLFALLIMVIIHFVLNQKWLHAGLTIALLMMTHPEGFILYFPAVLFAFSVNETWAKRLKSCLIMGIAAAILVIPWTLWRVSYYGYLIPNTIAAKEGMTLFYQLRYGM
ncbi:MAG: glycosyltransferase family 39 protein, partial [Betaproteobacteria bacterium]